MNWDDFMAPRYVIERLYETSQRARALPIELVTMFVWWLKDHLEEYALTNEDAVILITHFAARVDAVEGRAA